MKTLTIAVVDDDDSVRQSLHQLLRAADYEAMTFASAEEYLARRDVVDCLIVDVNLPGMTGVALVQTLAADGHRVPAILITARDDTTTIELIARAGTIPHLRKPFSDEQLFEAISRIVS
jgi:FixJ family two-component response regulator